MNKKLGQAEDELEYNSERDFEVICEVVVKMPLSSYQLSLFDLPNPIKR